MRGQHGEKMISAQYLGMPVEINDLDHENLDYFAYCAKHDFRLQRCASCKLFRYPPSTACPWCAELDSEWVSVEGRGTVHSYTEVHHAIQPAFKQYTPYLVLLVELDTQSGKPTKEAGLRVIGNLTRPDGVLAPKSEVERVGIGTRVHMVFTDVAPGLALPQWTIDENAASGTPWRYRGQGRRSPVRERHGVRRPIRRGVAHLPRGFDQNLTALTETSQAANASPMTGYGAKRSFGHSSTQATCRKRTRSNRSVPAQPVISRSTTGITAVDRFGEVHSTDIAVTLTQSCPSNFCTTSCLNGT